MGYVFLTIASFAGISKMAAMKSSGKLCPGAYNSVRINAFRSLLCAVVALSVFLASGAKASGEEWWLWLLSGLANAVMMFAWLLCTERISLVFVESFGMLGSVVVPLLLAPALYEGETVSLRQWIGTACLLVALIFLFAKKKKPKTKEVDNPETTDIGQKTTKNRGLTLTVAYIVLYVLSNAGLSITQKMYPVRVGKEYTSYFNLMTFAVVLICFFSALLGGRFFVGKSMLPENAASGKRLFAYVTVAAVMIYVYSYFATLAAEALPSAVYYPLARGINMLLTVLCDAFVFKQKPNKNVYTGLIFIFAAVLLTGI